MIQELLEKLFKRTPKTIEPTASIPEEKINKPEEIILSAPEIPPPSPPIVPTLPKITLDTIEKTIVKSPSPNFNNVDRNGTIWNITPKMIVIHWTDGIYTGAVQWLCAKESNVSAHFVIDSTGTKISQLVDLNKRAWHCGGSYHPELNTDTNSETIGIECEGPPSSIKTKEWSENFINALVVLCKYIQQKCPSIIGIVDHSTIMPTQKFDVKRGSGIDLFPWDSFIQKVGIKDYTTVDYSSTIRKHFGL